MAKRAWWHQGLARRCMQAARKVAKAWVWKEKGEESPITKALSCNVISQSCIYFYATTWGGDNSSSTCHYPIASPLFFLSGLAFLLSSYLNSVSALDEDNILIINYDNTHFLFKSNHQLCSNKLIEYRHMLTPFTKTQKNSLYTIFFKNRTIRILGLKWK